MADHVCGTRFIVPCQRHFSRDELIVGSQFPKAHKMENERDNCAYIFPVRSVCFCYDRGTLITEEPVTAAQNLFVVN